MNNKSGLGCLSYVTMFVSLLSTMFIVLKLTGVIDWNWWWVLAPIWIFVGLFVLLVALACIVTVLSSGDTEDKERKTK